ncbi:MAG: hypothetical protein KC931_08155, partial [Candidatus Omnitrophica bacterium]|nr:hypothetical protein [Candidatus Omnitrophota bacterium]
GLSLRPLVETGAVEEWRDNVCYDFESCGRVIRSSQYKYAMAYKHSGFYDDLLVDAKTGQPKAFEPGQGHTYERLPRCLLFDMKNDPWELTNLAEDPAYAEVIVEHERMLRDDWEAKMIPGSHFDRGKRASAIRLNRPL